MKPEAGDFLFLVFALRQIIYFHEVPFPYQFRRQLGGKDGEWTGIIIPVPSNSQECCVGQNKSMPVTVKYEKRGIQIF